MGSHRQEVLLIGPPALLLRYCLEKEDPSGYVLCDVIGQTGADHLWRTECFRVVGDHEKPLLLQSLWKQIGRASWRERV